MRNFINMVVGAVIATAVVLSYVFIALASVAGIIFAIQVIFETYKDLRKKWDESRKRRSLKSVESTRRSDTAGREFA